MKSRVFIALFVISLLTNIAGIVFFILYLDSARHVRSLKTERALLIENLNAVQTAEVIRSTNADKSRARTFVSHFDGTQDYFAVAPNVIKPQPGGYTLIVYLHGMGHSFMEPFTSPIEHPIAYAVTTTNPSLIFLSCNYRRQAAWASDAALADISQNIRETLQQYPIKQIVLMGCSMGGCVSLTYAALAPDEIKEKMTGVVSIEGAGDLAALYKQTDEPTVRGALNQCFGGPPDQAQSNYAAKSFISNIEKVPKKLRVAVISAREDKVVPPPLQAEIIKVCQSNSIEAKLVPVDDGHHMPPIECILTALSYVMR